MESMSSHYSVDSSGTQIGLATISTNSAVEFGTGSDSAIQTLNVVSQTVNGLFQLPSALSSLFVTTPAERLVA